MSELSVPAKLAAFLGPPSAIIFMATVSPKLGAATPLVFVPSVIAYKLWRSAYEKEPEKHAKLEPLLWTFATVGTFGLSVSAYLQLGVSKAAAWALFSDKAADYWTEFGRLTLDGVTSEQIANRLAYSSSWQGWVFNAILSFVCGGLLEESLKYLTISYASQEGTDQERKDRSLGYVDYITAGSLSIGMVESLGYLYATFLGAPTGGALVVTVAERIYGAVAHLFPGIITGLRATRRDYGGEKLSWWQVIWPAVLFHGTSNFIAMSAAAWGGNVGWIHPSGATSGVMYGLIVAVSSLAVRQIHRELVLLDQGKQDKQE